MNDAFSPGSYGMFSSLFPWFIGKSFSFSSLREVSELCEGKFVFKNGFALKIPILCGSRVGDRIIELENEIINMIC